MRQWIALIFFALIISCAWMKAQSFRFTDDKLKQGASYQLYKVYFVFATAELTQEGQDQLDSLVTFMKKHKEITMLQIGVHTGTRGTEQWNLDHSKARAKTILNYLAERGVEPTRMVAKGFGESYPLVTQEEIDAMGDSHNWPYRYKRNDRVSLRIMLR